MRIIAGEYRGRPLKAIKGNTTRPTTDRVREALMSVLVSARGGLEGAVALDAFAGSGALGLELMSRGARSVVFYERDAAAARVVSENIATLGVQKATRLVRADVFKRPPTSLDEPFDLVLLDPPYVVDPQDIADWITMLDDASILAPDAIVSYEYAKSDDSAAQAALESLQWEIVSRKTYGDTSITVMRKEALKQ